MSEVSVAKAGMGWSMSALAEEFNIDRKTVAKLIKGMSPCGSNRGRAVYRIKDVSSPIVKYFLAAEGVRSPEDFDPDDLHPKDRKDWYDSELKRIQHDKVTGELIPAEIVANADAAKNKKIALALDTMADVLERDVRLTPDQVTAVNRILDSIRNDLYADVISE